MADTGLMPGFGLIVPDWPDAPANIGALATTRQGGFSVGPYDDGRGGGGLNLGLHVGDDVANVQRNRALLQQVLPGRPAWIAQVHGVAVADAAKVQPGQPATVADASLARGAGVVSAVLTADCMPVLFADLQGTVVASAHAGWRGLAGGVLGTTLAAMRAAGAGEITAWLGPAIGPQRFEVGEDVRSAFVAALGAAQALPAFVDYPGRPGKYLANMALLARAFLAREGVTRVAGGDDCTVTEVERFYSYRRDGVSGRQATLIWLK